MTSIAFDFRPLQLEFITPARTSRDVMYVKPSWIIYLRDPASGKTGIGECSIIPGLSSDDPSHLEATLHELRSLHDADVFNPENFIELPALRFALETAWRSLQADAPFELWPSPFTQGKACIPINGLIWMDDDDAVLKQIRDRANEGFRILKMKIGSGDFPSELKLLQKIRDEYPARDFELRLDANGAFHPPEAQNKLEQLAKFNIHSIEQPIRPRQWDALATLCAHSPIPIALDEELIGLPVDGAFLDRIQPQYLILKPSLLGGFAVSTAWAEAAAERGMGWWATSALESNIGLNAIAQWCAAMKTTLPQGLGTGRLYTNNIAAPLRIADAALCMGHDVWDLGTFAP